MAERNPLPAPPAEPTAKVALFPTCFVNYYNPAPGKAAVEVFAKNGCAVKCPKQNCCGMPALDGGDVEFARKEARANIDSMLPLVREGYKIAAINPTCSLMMRQEYPNLLAGDDVKEFAAAIVDPHELLYQLRRAGKFNTEFQSTPGHGRVSRPVSSEGAGHRAALARPDAPDSGRRSRRRSTRARRMTGPGR